MGGPLAPPSPVLAGVCEKYFFWISLLCSRSIADHILKIIDSKERKEVTYKEVKKQFENELLLEKGKEAERRPSVSTLLKTQRRYLVVCINYDTAIIWIRQSGDEKEMKFQNHYLGDWRSSNI